MIQRVNISSLIEKFSNKADRIEARIERRYSTTILLQNGEIERINEGREWGLSFRVFLRGGIGFASTNDPKRISQCLERAIKMARILAGNWDKLSIENDESFGKSYEPRARIDPRDLSPEEKIEIMREAHSRAIDGRERVKSVSIGYFDVVESHAFIDDLGREISYEMPRYYSRVLVVSREAGKIATAFETSGRTDGLVDLDRIPELAARASSRSIRLLEASRAPSGRMDVVMDPKLAGVFLHEALGHASEADLVEEGSILKDKIGERLAPDFVTVVDDPTLEGLFGSYPVDSEGIKSRKKAIIEEGILKTYLHSRLTAGKFSSRSTGNARAESYADRPIVRMSNVYMLPGDMDLEELLEGIREGLLLMGSRGGEVDPIEGRFQFSAEEGYRIVDGELREPVRDVGIRGATLDLLKRIDAISKDLELSPGFCGKEGQSVPVSDGGPYVRVRGAIVG